MTTRNIMVVGTSSNVGKTTVTLGLMAAYKALGYTVQGFKCGPDYIDPTYQTVITGRQSRNLDSWMCDEEFVREIYARGSEGADIAISEGVMGMFDGKDPLSNVGSSAELAAITNTPVLLVLDGSGLARSAAAIVKGFQTLSPEVDLCGVVANRVGSEGHFKLIKQAVETECKVPVVGYLTRDDRLTLPERYAGLVPLLNNKYDELFAEIATIIQENFDLTYLYDIMGRQKVTYDEASLLGLKRNESDVKIAVAKDDAFHFYYEENLELLEQSGAELVYFSPLEGDKLPEDVHGLYIGGGFPEQYAKQLSEQRQTMVSIKEAIKKGLPTLAEGGGFMYLTNSITDFENKTYAMTGLISGDVKMESRLVGLGYRTAKGNKNNFLLGAGESAKGHVFHYSSFTPSDELMSAYQVSGRRGEAEDGVAKYNLVASYTHLHFASSPSLAKRWVSECELYKEQNE